MDSAENASPLYGSARRRREGQPPDGVDPGPGPLVSVVLPVYNAAEFVGSAVRSVLDQSYGRIELLLLDDGSTDGSTDILSDLAGNDPRIRLISRENRGLVATLNEGLALANGPLVARMDADDIAHPERLARQVAEFAADEGLAACGTGYDIAKAGRIMRRAPEPLQTPETLTVLSMFYTIFIHPTVMFDRRVVGEDLRYDPRYPHAEDFELFRRIARRHRCRLIPDSLLVYRVHAESVTGRHRREMRLTHLRIVTQNLRDDGFEGPLEPLLAFGETPHAALAHRVGEIWRDLQGQAARKPSSLSGSYAAGLLNLFYFIYDLLIDQADPVATSAFLDGAEGWSRIRRREALALRLDRRFAHGASPLVAASRRIDDAVFTLRSSPIAVGHPGFAT
ncbi:MAG: glycosyltransferase family 2 protein [Brevundimonas sp.]|uniref:glycosyltransferase family 2 protein n=1 Tax=Brevundimonas sp. TaxID=1871086 RepID=UPI00391899B4